MLVLLHLLTYLPPVTHKKVWTSEIHLPTNVQSPLITSYLFPSVAPVPTNQSLQSRWRVQSLHFMQENGRHSLWPLWPLKAKEQQASLGMIGMVCQQRSNANTTNHGTVRCPSRFAPLATLKEVLKNSVGYWLGLSSWIRIRVLEVCIIQSWWIYCTTEEAT